MRPYIVSSGFMNHYKINARFFKTRYLYVFRSNDKKLKECPFYPGLDIFICSFSINFQCHCLTKKYKTNVTENVIENVKDNDM